MTQSKIALVTGATRGIGLAIAEELCRDYQVLIGGRDPERTALIADAIPGAWQKKTKSKPPWKR